MSTYKAINKLLLRLDCKYKNNNKICFFRVRVKMVITNYRFK